MYFIVDLLLLIILLGVVITSIKFGFTRNFIFGIIRTVIAFAGGIGACVGVFLLMNHFGWIDYLADAVVGFFGSPDWLNQANPDNLRIVARIIAYLPFALLFLILGYLFMHWFINLIVRLVFAPIFVSRKKVKGIKIVDNILGFILNFAIYAGIVLAIFGFVHGINTVADEDGDKVYDNFSTVMFGEPSGGVTDFLADTVDKFTAPMFLKWHESFSASPIGSLIYEYNPLNGVFEGIVESIYGL